MRINTKFLNAALDFFQRGLTPIPTIHGTKQTAVRWNAWMASLSEQKIRDHWARHPEHEVGCIIVDDHVVLDADTEAAVAKVYELLEAHDVVPIFKVQTTRGIHVHLLKAPDVFVKTRAISSEEVPHGIDIKAARSLVIMPPSTGKKVLLDEMETISDLPVVGQCFIDAVYRNNGWEPPRPPAPTLKTFEAPASADLQSLEALCRSVDSDCGYDVWLNVLMAVYNATGGSEEGFAIVNAWSALSTKYPGETALLTKWRSFANYEGTPVTIGTLIMHAQNAGAQIEGILSGSIEEFDDEGDTIVVYPGDSGVSLKAATARTPLDRYSLTGSSQKLAALRQNAVFVLLPIALLGQATVIYAAPNTGKTLVVLRLTMDSIAEERIEPLQVYYVNADDSLDGICEKTQIAEELGFHVIADGWEGFRPDRVVAAMLTMIEDDTARGVIIILDTLKRFTDLMSKRYAAEFTAVARRFTARGGTIIGLAHTNKRRGDDGKPIFAGTSDVVDDFDCAYVVDLVDDGKESGRRVIHFNCIKNRGPVAEEVFFAYLTRGNAGSYRSMLDSFAQLDPEDADDATRKAQLAADAPLVSTVVNHLTQGAASKKDLQELLRDRHGVSRASASQIIERYCGSDPEQHRWAFTRGEHGRHQYRLIGPAAATQGVSNDTIDPGSF